MNQAAVIFRRIGNRIVPIRISKGVKLEDATLKTETFKKAQETLKNGFRCQIDAIRKPRKFQ